MALPLTGASTMDRSPNSRNDSGLATVEFAIVGSLLCLLVFAIISVGIFINAHMQAAKRRSRRSFAPLLSLVRRRKSPTESSWKELSPKPYAWVVPFIPYPGDAQESAGYRCGG